MLINPSILIEGSLGAVMGRWKYREMEKLEGRVTPEGEAGEMMVGVGVGR